MKKEYNNKFEKMTTAPIKGLISSLAVPTILTMLVSAVYNMADSYFVGKIDTTSVASIGIVFSIMTLLQAIGFFLGNGSGIVISHYLGEKDKKTASLYANTAFFSALLIGILLAVTGIFFSQPISKMLGATSTTIQSASAYLKIILLGAPFILGSFVLNNQLRYQGSAIYSMAGIMSGSLLNILLDPLFIFTLKQGVSGAAAATAVSQIFGFIILVIGTFKGENLRISIKSFRISRKIFTEIFKNGLPSLARQGIGTLANICINFACAPYGDAAVAGISVFNRVMFFGFAIVIGYGQGFQPVCGFNDGAKKYDRVYKGYKFTALITTVIITVYAAVAYIFAPELIGIFRDDPDVIEIGVKALRTQCIIMPVFGFCTSSNMLMQSLKISIKATILALARQGIFYIPLAFILPHFFGETGITLVQPMADGLSFLLTITITLPTLKTLKKKSSNKG